MAHLVTGEFTETTHTHTTCSFVFTRTHMKKNDSKNKSNDHKAPRSGSSLGGWGQKPFGEALKCPYVRPVMILCELSQ